MTEIRRRRARIYRGDVIEIDLPQERVAYIQNLGVNRLVRKVRFLPGIFDKRLDEDELKSLVAGRSLYRGNCLIEFEVADGVARVVRRLPIPQAEAAFPAMIAGDWAKDPMEWWVCDSDGSEMQAREYLLAHPGAQLQDLPIEGDIPDRDTLIERIEAGWTPGH